MSDTTNPDSVHDHSRKRLYNILSEEDDLEAKRRAIIELGADYLGVQLGFVSAIDTDRERFEVLVSTDGEILAEGATYGLPDTYCRRCVETDSSLAVSDALSAGWQGDPAYDEHGLDCYLGTPIHVDGELVGTLCFADTDPRETDFSPSERAFVELAARLLGREHEIRQYERQLDERERRLDERQRELDTSEEKYESLLTTAPDAIFVAREADGELVDVNDAAEKLTGMPASELVGQKMREFHPGGVDRHWAEFQRFIADGEGTLSRYSDGTHLRIQRADGTEVPVEHSTQRVEIGGTEYVQGIVRDVSDRVERERELRLKNRAIDEASIGITIADADPESDYGLVYANEEFQRITGYDWDEIVTRNCRFLQGERTDEATVEEIGAALADDEPVRTELLNYRKNGTPFWNALRLAPVEDADGNVTHFVGFQQDVTDRKRKEKLITVLNRVLRHNLRNGMSVIWNRVELMQEELGDDAPPSLDAIRSRAEKLTAVGEKAGSISKSLEHNRTVEPMDAVPMVESIAERIAASGDATVSVDAPAGQSVLATNSLRVALEELGTNAVAHAGPDPTVEFTVEATDNGRVAIRVSDDGPGLPPEERTVLERGYETPLEHGSGLGLWFVTWVVTGLGGNVTVDVGDGTTVTLWLRSGNETSGRGQQSAIER